MFTEGGGHAKLPHRQAKNESGPPLPLLAALWKQYSFLMM